VEIEARNRQRSNDEQRISKRNIKEKTASMKNNASDKKPDHNRTRVARQNEATEQNHKNNKNLHK